MSMEDILKVLVDSRQQGSTPNTGDSMVDLIGGLLGGGQPQQGIGNQQSGGLGNMMGLLESVMGSGQGSSQSVTNDPIMMLLQPFVTPLAKKANIPPEIAMVVVSFVAHKLLSHHPTSGRDSNTFNLDEMLQQMGSGKIDSNLLQGSGMVGELSRRTGLDQATAEKSLQLGFSLVGKSVSSLINKRAGKLAPKPKAPTGKPMKTLKATGRVKSAAKSVKKK